MTERNVHLARCLILAAVPAMLFANSGTNAAVPAPPLKRTGAQADGGLSCTACHATFPVNSGSGFVRIHTGFYTPGVKQTVVVEVSDPDGQRWGFQLIARLVSDETRQAGTFSTSDDVQVRCDDGQVRGAPAPCNNQLEFASHTGPGTRAGTAGPRKFTVEWTPPATDVGPIQFYAAGNAANGNLNSQGDRIYTTSYRIGSCSMTVAPTIRDGGIGNAASFRPLISSNGMISIFGSGFARAGDRWSATAGDVIDDKLSTELACVAVEVGGKRAPVGYVQADQINAQAPILEGVGPMPVRVILNPGRPSEVRSAALNAQVGTYSPAFFTFNGRSIAALNVTQENKILADTSVVPGGVSARPGDIVTLYGTGFSYTDPVYQTGEFSSGPAPLRDAVTVTIGGVELGRADVLYGGLSPDAPGFYQFNVRVPASVADGNAAVTIRIGGVATQDGATIPVKR